MPFDREKWRVAIAKQGTIAEFSRRSGVPLRTLHYILNNDGSPSMRTLVRMTHQRSKGEAWLEVLDVMERYPSPVLTLLGLVLPPDECVVAIAAIARLHGKLIE